MTLAGGARAAGFSTWGFTAGARADLLVLDRAEPALAGIPRECLLDALVFSTPCDPWRDVLVAGEWRVNAKRHNGLSANRDAFEEAMRSLWNV
jgi:formimidoylglutamate deiminase